MTELDALTKIVADYGYLAVFCTMFLEGMCIPIPSELIMGFAGYMVYQGHFSLTGAILAGWLGSFSGSFSIYLLARKGGRKYLYRWGHVVGLGPRRLDIIGDWFNRYGPPLIIPWRQLPVIRTKISIAAGLMDMRYVIFTAYTALGIAVWCSLSVFLGYYFGQNWQNLLAIFTELGHYIILAIFGIILSCALFVVYHKRRKIKEEVR
ncbi:MAG: DedA family protein [Negativicutes bacterium]|nr:DedA family protein [Negativicutes bacterium]